ncbi:uncharacterized protein [Salmo salar]|uniref:ribonuclease H n=1 Tax=Salmo salar TaxID=8030 RepID=A0ABM3DA51_SALSA|nr:uncharacterized protein LOC123728223 [Salmo salar]
MDVCKQSSYAFRNAIKQAASPDDVRSRVLRAYADQLAGCLRVSGNNSEAIQFLPIESPLIPVHNLIQDAFLGSREGAPDLSAIPAEHQNLREVFSKTRAMSLPLHRPYDCGIYLLPSTTPPRGRLYSLSGLETKAMETYIVDHLATGFIHSSSSPAGFFFMEKKDKTLPTCIDYRRLNDITDKNRYPQQLISSAFEPLQGATVFSKLDLRNAYHLVRIRDEWKTAFNTASGHYEYLVMPFGLTNTPAMFQALVNDVLRDMLNRFVFICIDDILVFSRSAQEHVLHIRQVLQCLLEKQLFVKVKKCEFYRSTIVFLGYIISNGSVQMDPGKVRAVMDWPQPTSRVQLQRFLGFVHFYRRLSGVTVPWLPPCQHSPHPRFHSHGPQLLTGISGISNIASPQLPSWFIRTHLVSSWCRPMLRTSEWGLSCPSIPPLTSIYIPVTSSPIASTPWKGTTMQARWALLFTRFDFSLSYRLGSKNVKPDALSHRYSPTTTTPEPKTILRTSCLVTALSWGIGKQVREAQRSQPNPGRGTDNRMFVPDTVCSEVLEWAHSSRLVCHQGTHQTLAFVRQRFWWPTMVPDVSAFDAACSPSSRPPPSIDDKQIAIGPRLPSIVSGRR